MRNRAPREDWCKVDSTKPKMVRTMVSLIARLRVLVRPSHSKGAGGQFRCRLDAQILPQAHGTEGHA